MSHRTPQNTPQDYSDRLLSLLIQAGRSPEQTAALVHNVHTVMTTVPAAANRLTEEARTVIRTMHAACYPPPNGTPALKF